MPTLETLPRIVQLALRAADHLGYQTRIVDPAYGYLFEVSDGQKRRYFVGGLSPLNDAVGARLAQDKYYTAMILAEHGFHVTNGVRCFRPGYFQYEKIDDRNGLETGIQKAKEVGYPVIVKPNRMSLGRNVVPAHDEPALIQAIQTVWEADYIALVQQVAPGTDVRLDFLDGTFLAGYRRRPVEIRGDGQQTIRALLKNRDQRFGDDEFFGRRKAEELWTRKVTNRGWTAETVLPPGQKLSFDNPVLNLNRWATAEVLDDVPEPWLRFCLSVGQVLHLRHFGLDLRVPISQKGRDWRDENPQTSVIIEVNASPALVQLHDLGYTDKAITGQARILRALFDT